MDFEYSDRTRELQARVTAFMEAHIYPNEVTYHEQIDAGDTRWKPVPTKAASKTPSWCLRTIPSIRAVVA